MSGQQNKRFDVVGIGNAIVDVIARTDDDFLIARGLHKGSMSLIEADAAAALRATMQSPAIVSGGSAANTIAGLASFGLNAAFVGKVHDDAAGRAFVAGYSRCRCAFRDRSGDRWPTHRAMSCSGHAGRRAHDVDVSWCLPRADTDRC